MTGLEIYNTEGGLEFSTDRADDKFPEIDTFNKDDIDFGVRNEDRVAVYYLRFRARETVSSRRNIYYARYIPSDTEFTDRTKPVRELIDLLHKKADQEWGYIVDDPTDDVLQGRDLESLDNLSNDIGILKRLLKRNLYPSIDVPSSRTATEIACSVGQTVGKSAAFSGKEDLMSDWDLVIQTGTTSGIEPKRGTRSDWRGERKRLRNERTEKELDSIRDSVNKLSNEHGLTTKQIRERVHNRVPELKSPKRNTRTPTQQSTSQPSRTQNKSSGVELKYILALIGIVLLVLFLIILVSEYDLLPSIDTSGLPVVGATIYSLSGPVIN